MKLEIVCAGEPRKMVWNKRSSVGTIFNMFVPADEYEDWQITDERGRRLWPHEELGDVLADGQRVFITRKPVVVA